MHRKRGEVNGTHMCKNGNLMRQEGSVFLARVCVLRLDPFVGNMAHILLRHISTNYSVPFFVIQ